MDWRSLAFECLVALIVGCMVLGIVGSSSKVRQLAEYGLVIILVGLIAVVVLAIIGPNVGDPFSTINHSLTGV